ncbi:MAG: polymer-forming cytoskeletal protein [Halobacteriaceae archaeon]
MVSSIGRRGIALLIAGFIVLATVPGLAAAETRAGGTIVVEEGTTVDGLQVMGGSVVVRGTVDGSIQGLAGSVVIADTGHVTGNVEVATGSLTIAGTVDGSVEAAAGSVTIEETAVIGGAVRVGAESLTIAGTVQGTVEAGVQTLRLTGSAVVNGDVRHGTETSVVTEQGATVTGQVVAVDDLHVNVGIGPVTIPQIASWAVTLYGAVLLFIVGAIMLAAFPRFTDGVADRVATAPLRTAGVGLAGLVGVLAAVIALVITIIGIPIALLLVFLFVLAVIAAVVLGQYAIGAWTLSLAEVDNRWAALLVGIVFVSILSRIPYVGWLVDLTVFALGFGALLLALRGAYRNRGSDEDTAETGSAETT